LKPLATYPQQRRGRCKCCLSADPSLGSWLRPNKGKCQHFNHVKAIRTRTYYKSEEYDITEPAAVDSMKAAEGSSEVVLASSWWEQVPKRWVIVLLCFTAFLLCNMDRVSTSFRFSFLFSCHRGLKFLDQVNMFHIPCVRDKTFRKLGTLIFK
jgi:hypothetical protein